MPDYESLQALVDAHKHGGRIRYDVKLFSALNDWYADKPLVPAPRKTTLVELSAQSLTKTNRLIRHFPFLPEEKPRTLEIGCGAGTSTVVFAQETGCEVVGVDIMDRPEWRELPEGVDLRVFDISSEDISPLGKFKFIFSFAVWEHMKHPYAALKAAYELLESGGVFYFYANLYRGPQASHRYREVFFPWPHLLFEEDVFVQYYKQQGRAGGLPAWVNKLVAAEYLEYFRLIGFQVKKIQYSKATLDEELYAACEDKLGRYPRFDLEQNFIYATVTKA